MIVGATAQRPAIFPVLFADRQIIDRHKAHRHQAVRVASGKNPEQLGLILEPVNMPQQIERARRVRISALV
jgi:hypothetical protein